MLFSNLSTFLKHAGVICEERQNWKKRSNDPVELDIMKNLSIIPVEASYQVNDVCMKIFSYIKGVRQRFSM